mgnify:CR=1 FL=1
MNADDRGKDLKKRYGNKLAVNDVSFTVENGEILGFLGPNGAGKSTTMNIITGYLSSTEGTVTIDGCEILEDPIGAKSKIGYLPEFPPLYPGYDCRDSRAFDSHTDSIHQCKIQHNIQSRRNSQEYQ